MMVGSYTKAIAGAVVAGLTGYAAALPGGVTPAEGLGIAATTIVAGGAVWAIPSVPASVRKYGKAGAAGVLGSLGVLTVALLGDGIGHVDVVNAVLALIIGSGLTGIAPNSFASDDLLPGYDRYAAAEDTPQYDPTATYEDIEPSSPSWEADRYLNGGDLPGPR